VNQRNWATPKPHHHIFGVLFFGANKNPPKKRTLVGGFNPFEKYARQIEKKIPKFRDEN